MICHWLMRKIHFHLWICKNSMAPKLEGFISGAGLGLGSVTKKLHYIVKASGVLVPCIKHEGF